MPFLRHAEIKMSAYYVSFIRLMLAYRCGRGHCHISSCSALNLQYFRVGRNLRIQFFHLI